MKFSHENIVKFLGLSVNEDKIYFLIEYCKGGSLFDKLRDKSYKLDSQQRLKILIETAKAVHYLHIQFPPIIHRDIKSHNVLLSQNISSSDSQFAVKLADFGISKITSGTNTLFTMNCPGTTHWQAPEILVGKRYSSKCDVYSFSMLMYEVFSGKIPYQGLNLQIPALMFRIVSGLRPDLKKLKKDTPQELIELMTTCWKLDEADRPDIESVLFSLLKIQEKYSISNYCNYSLTHRLSSSSNDFDFQRRTSQPSPNVEHKLLNSSNSFCCDAPLICLSEANIKTPVDMTSRQDCEVIFLT